MLASRLSLAKRLLSACSSIYVHVGRNVSALVKTVCDDIFGRELFRNEVTWKRSHAHGDTGQGATHFGRVSESLLFYALGGNPIWNPQYIPYSDDVIARDYKYIDEATGKRYRLMPVDGPGGGKKGNPHYTFLGVTGYWRYSEATMQSLYDNGVSVRQDYLRASFRRRARRALVWAARAKDSASR